MWSSFDSPNEAFKLIAELRKFSGRYFDLSKADQAEIKTLTDKLDVIQKACGHNWQEYTLMNGIYQECRYCAKNERVR